MISIRFKRERSALPELALSLAILAAVGFSVVLTSQLLWMQLVDRANYTFANVLGVPGRNRLLLSVAAGLALPPLAALLVLLRRSGPGLRGLHRAAVIASPLLLLFVLPGLFLTQVAAGKPLFYLIVLSAFGLALRALLSASLAARAESEPSRLRRWLASRALVERLGALKVPNWAALLFVCVAAAGYAWFLGAHAVAHHRLIQTIDTDVGIADNVMANLASGHFFRAPAYFGSAPGNYLSVHTNYSSLLLVPIYRLHPGSELLLRLQAAIAALSVIPLFLLTKHLLGQRMAVWASFAFLSLAPLQGALLYGFSWLPLFCLFSFTLYYAVLTGRRGLSLVALVLLLTSSEAAPLAVLALGVFLAARVKKTRIGAGLGLAGFAMFALNTAVAAHLAGAPVAPPPLVSAARALLSNPVYFTLDLARAMKVTSMLHALAPLALLPLATLSALPLLLPGVLFTSSSVEFWPSAHAAYPFTLLWIPGCMLAALFLLHRLRNSPGERPLYLATVATLSVTLLSHSYDYGAFLSSDAFGGNSPDTLFQITPEANQRYADLQKVVSRIPANASVAATTFMLSHVSNRPDAFNAERPFGEPEYLFLSARELPGPASTWLAAAFATHHYALLTSAGEFYLFKRGSETQATRETVRRLGLSS